MNLIFRLLRKNTSLSRLAGCLASNLIGLAIIGAGLQFYLDARSIWQQKDSFLKSDYLAVNKVIGAANTLGGGASTFSDSDIADLQAQPWVERVGEFSRADFNVHASVALQAPAEGEQGRSMSTAMFFEAVPDDFLDIPESDFSWHEGAESVPVIISKDYLALYNFGFASAAGLPQLSENLISGIPLRLTLSSDDGSRRVQMYGRVAGYSNRFNTILVPQNFLDYMNSILASGPAPESASASPAAQGASEAAQRGSGKASHPAPSRLIVDVNSPGDAAIGKYLKAHGLEVAGDKSAAGATYLLRVVTGIVMGVGGVITLLAILIMVLSMSLLMEKNRQKIHSLLMLGYQPYVVARPFWRLTAVLAISAAVLATGCILLLRWQYLTPLESLGATPSGLGWTLLLIAGLTIIIILLNCHSITGRIRAAWRR